MSNGESKKQPVQEIRMGLIKAAVWANQTKSNGIMHNVTLGARISRCKRRLAGDAVVGSQRLAACCQSAGCRPQRSSVARNRNATFPPNSAVTAHQ